MSPEAGEGLTSPLALLASRTGFTRWKIKSKATKNPNAPSPSRSLRSTLKLPIELWLLLLSLSGLELGSVRRRVTASRSLSSSASLWDLALLRTLVSVADITFGLHARLRLRLRGRAKCIYVEFGTNTGTFCFPIRCDFEKVFAPNSPYCLYATCAVISFFSRNLPIVFLVQNQKNIA